LNTRDIIREATAYLLNTPGHVFDVLTLSRPTSVEEAINLSKVVSKLSPLIGNHIEFRTVDMLNLQEVFKPHGRWTRQDPEFPDALFEGKIQPPPGFEIKAWFPLATEITARFKDSQNRFSDDATYICMLAWLPESVIFGKPKIVDAVVVSGASVAKARDEHYHNPPDYVVIEPEDTSARTRNLRQTNTNGYKWQGSPQQFEQAKRIVESWGPQGRSYQPTREYQARLRTDLLARFKYRLDTNYAKMDRIVHKEIEAFKTRVLAATFQGISVQEWAKLFGSEDDKQIGAAFKKHLGY
jgi:hypothetical protein